MARAATNSLCTAFFLQTTCALRPRAGDLACDLSGLHSPWALRLRSRGRPRKLCPNFAPLILLTRSSCGASFHSRGVSLHGCCQLSSHYALPTSPSELKLVRSASLRSPAPLNPRLLRASASTPATRNFGLLHPFSGTCCSCFRLWLPRVACSSPFPPAVLAISRYQLPLASLPGPFSGTCCSSFRLWLPRVACSSPFPSAVLATSCSELPLASLPAIQNPWPDPQHNIACVVSSAPVDMLALGAKTLQLASWCNG